MMFNFYLNRLIISEIQGAVACCISATDSYAESVKKKHDSA